MINKLPLGAWVNENRESTKVDKVWKYLDNLFDPNKEPNGIFLYDWGNEQSDDNGAARFAKVVQSEAYKAFADKEMQFYNTEDQLRYQIESHFSRGKVRNIIDMGPGDGEKSAPLLHKMFGKKMEWKTYIPVDISPWFVQHAGWQVKNHFYEKDILIRTAGINMNFLESDAALKDIKDKMYMFFGWSIGNFSDEEIIQILKNMSSEKAFGETSSIVLSYFTAPDKEKEDYVDQIQKLLGTYGSPDKSNPYFNASTHEAIEWWIMGWFAALWIDIDKLEFHVTYDEENTKMLLGAKVKETFSIKHNNKIYTKEAGDTLWAIQSKRFTREKMSSLIHEAGAEMWLPFEWDGIGMGVMEAARSEESKKIVKKTKLSAIAAAVALTLLSTWGYVGSKWEEKQNKEKEKKEWIKTNAPYFQGTGEYRWMYSLSASWEQAAESAWEMYDRWYSTPLKMAYGVDDEKASLMQRSFLSWYAKQLADNRYSRASRMGGGEELIHAINDYVYERGDEFGITTHDYFKYAELPIDAIQTTLNDTITDEVNDLSITPWTQKTFAMKFYMDIFDNEVNKLWKIGVATWKGKRYIVAAPLLDNDNYGKFSIDEGRRFLSMIYRNAPGLFPFSKKLAQKYEIVVDNSSTWYEADKYYNNWAQEEIQRIIGDLLSQGYKFDFYQMNTKGSEHWLHYFVKTFLPYPDSMYKGESVIHNREYFNKHDLKPLLNECIKYIETHMNHKKPIIPFKQNRLKSIIFSRIFINGAWSVDTYSAEEVVKELKEDLLKELETPLVHSEKINNPRGGTFWNHRYEFESF